MKRALGPAAKGVVLIPVRGNRSHHRGTIHAGGCDAGQATKGIVGAGFLKSGGRSIATLDILNERRSWVIGVEVILRILMISRVERLKV